MYSWIILLFNYSAFYAGKKAGDRRPWKERIKVRTVMLGSNWSWSTEIRNVYEYIITCFRGVGTTHLQTQRILQLPSWSAGKSPISHYVSISNALIIFVLSSSLFFLLAEPPLLSDIIIFVLFVSDNNAPI